jgi:hypothetical protein
MKVGDLVALSSYAEGLKPLKVYSSSYRERYFSKKPLMGIVVEEMTRSWVHNPSQQPFRVRWLNEPDPKLRPDGRAGFFGPSYFTRKDLKIVRAPSKKKPLDNHLTTLL